MLSICHVANKLLSGHKPAMYSVASPAVRRFSKYHNNEQIYIHDHTNNSCKISLSPREQSLPIGYSDSVNDIVPEKFRPNPEFVQLLHKQIQDHIQNDFSFIIEAGVNANSFMPIYDFREIPRYGRIPEIDNIYGYVQVDSDGKIVPGTYESNNMYRVCNGVGLIKLSDYLYDRLKAQCEEITT